MSEWKPSSSSLGFSDFGQFGSPPGRVLEYFAGVKQALARAEPSLEGRIVVHEPPPTGSIAERVESLHVAIEKLLAGEALPHNPPLSADSVRLVGHSAGGVDARLVAHPGYAWPRGPSGSERERVRGAIRRVVTLSSPHRGTPIATGEQSDFRALVLAVTAVSVFGMGRFSLLTPLSMMITAIGHFAPDALRALATDPVLGLVSGLDADAAREIERYFDELASDQRLMDDLTVSSMGRLEAALSARDRVPVDCFVSSSPTPGFGISHPLGRFLYKRLYAATASAIVPGPSPSGPIVNGSAPPFPLGQHASDGVVPVTSQTLDGHAAGIVFGDHEDVIGHFSGGPGTTVFKSDSNFDVARFQALWADIARRLV